jgi:CHASE2 domain-containing sensor protein
MSPKKAKHITIFLGITVTFLVVGLYYMQIGFIESFEARTYDMRLKSLRHSIVPNKDIAIIAIDDKSVAELGRFPWSRKFGSVK